MFTVVSVEDGHPLEKDFAYNNNVAQAHVSVRMGFLRKVYGILFTQLFITVILAGVMFYFKEPLLKNDGFNLSVMMFSVIGTIVFLIALFFKKHVTPLNYLLLLGFTICEAFLIGFVVMNYSASIVIQALGLTTAVTFCLMSYAMQTKRDISQWGAGLFAGLFLLISAGFVNFMLGSSLLELSMAVGGSALFSLFIIYDTHRIMHHCSPEDYIVACVDLYLDILNLFLYILRILKETQGNQ